MKNIPYIAAAILSFSTVMPASAENAVIGKAGLSATEIQVPAPEAPKANQWMTLRKITVNEAQPDMNDTLIGIVRGMNIDAAVKELNANGFKASALQDNHGGYMVMVDVKGQNAADMAVGLARYYYVEEVKVGQAVHNQLFGLNNKSRSTYAVKQGTIKGGMNHSQVDVKFNKLDWTIKGGINNSPLDIRIDHQQSTITGGANLSPVDLKFDWSTEEVRVYGGANHSQINYTVNWKGGLLQGYLNHAPLKLEFNMGEGYVDQTIVGVNGYAGNAPVGLVYNKVNGHIGGYMNNSPVDINLVNCDLYDFLQYLFVFVK